MNRLLWLAAGAAAGLVVTLVLRPDAVKAATAFWDDVRDGMREREAELRTALGIDGADEGAADSDDVQPAEGTKQ